VLNRAAWVKDNRFISNSGSLVRIRYTGGAQPAAVFPKRLSQTDLFADVATLELKPGLISFELNAPIWLPGVSVERWLRLPKGKRIHLGTNGDLALPSASVLIQHFIAAGRRLETHVYWCRDSNCYRAAAYRWNDAGGDAALVEDGEVIAIGSKRHWFSPGTEECLRAETAVSGFVLQLNTRQINRATLRHWNELGILEPKLRSSALETLDQLEPLSNEHASLELRVRSWLDANCAVCHQPGGPSRGLFDARFSTPLNDQRLINGELVAGDLGISGARVIVPGSPEKSILYQRLKRTDFFRMPPVSVNDEASPVLPILAQWIRSLGASSK
jgi:hypothetical protein